MIFQVLIIEFTIFIPSLNYVQISLSSKFKSSFFGGGEGGGGVIDSQEQKGSKNEQGENIFDFFKSCL